MEFGIEKCAIIVVKNGKRQLTDGMETAKSRQDLKARRKGNLQIFGDIES